MLMFLLVAFLASCILVLGLPILAYFYDAKGFRKYPRQNVFSGLSPLAYGWEVGRPHHRIFNTQRLHARLAKDPVVRIGPNWLSFGRAAAVRDVYGFNSPCEKGGIYGALGSGGGAESLVLSTAKAAHVQRRSVVAASYAAGNIRAWEPKVVDSTSTLVSKLDALCAAAPSSGADAVPEHEPTFDARLWSLLYSFECTIKIGLSKDMGLLAQGSDVVSVELSKGITVRAPIIECLRSRSRATATIVWDVANFPWLKKATALVSTWYERQWRNASIWSAWIEQATMERIERGKKGEYLEDLFQPMVQRAKGSETEFCHIDRVAEVHQIVHGGGEKTGISIANTLYYLLKHPETLARLRGELDESLTEDDAVAPWSKVKRMTYLRACVKESLRLSPPVASDLPRTTPRDRAYVVAGEAVPPGTDVSISAYTAHRDPAIFVDPEAFCPDRWIITADAERLRDMTAAYIPFSTGARACVGRNLALLMQLVFVATVVHRYDFALPSPDWTVEWEECFTLWPRELPLKISKRQMNTQSRVEGGVDRLVLQGAEKRNRTG
ncbi:Cytochrome P450 [Cordyceps javanica]|uniref:Cytochrome P450 n=1 Tax=Cordyceps javanica TaxID=43265 RepID=A0A545VF20_9HYPO|nr:Cytochrome P450 [Cordyceps javanica]TQW11514.1 Cytochrome P450 [Cordyceps javanica]